MKIKISKKIFITFGAISIPSIFVISILSTNNKNVENNKSNNIKVLPVNYIEGAPSKIISNDISIDYNPFNIKEFVPSNVIVNPLNFKDIEASSHPKSEGWSSTYNMLDYENIIDPSISYDFMTRNGWTDINEYQKYLQYHYEVIGGETQFGHFYQHDWIAWHFAKGTVLDNRGHSGSYNDGKDSEVRPTWLKASDTKLNNINNSLNWYYYDRGTLSFSWDQNNMENAWKRLVFEKRIIPVSIAQANDEEGEDSEGNTIRRNSFMVNGKFTDRLSPIKNYYYVLDDNQDNYVRDNYGWKVLITDEDKNTIFRTVINSQKKGIFNELGVSDTRKFVEHNIYIENFSKNYGTSYDAAYSELDKEKLVEIDYPQKYEINVLESLESLKNEFSNKTSGSKKALWSGLYRLAPTMGNSFENMVKDRHTVLPHEYYISNMIDPFGVKIPQFYSHPWNTGGYGFLWVEDGNGGHKVWKSLYKLEEKAKDKSLNLGVNFRFYGNFNHVFPAKGKTWFTSQKLYIEDKGI